MKWYHLFGGLIGLIVLLIWGIVYSTLRWIFTGEFFND